MLIKKIINYIRLRRLHKIDVLTPYDPINCKCVFEPLPADNIRVIDGNVPKHNHSLDAMRYSDAIDAALRLSFVPAKTIYNKEEKTMRTFLICMQNGDNYLVSADLSKEAVNKVVASSGTNTYILDKTVNCLSNDEYIYLANIFLKSENCEDRQIKYVGQVEVSSLYGSLENANAFVIS